MCPTPQDYDAHIEPERALRSPKGFRFRVPPESVTIDRENPMTAQVAEEIAELDINDIKVVSAEVIDRALATIDSALAQMVRRELVSADEVSDLLLDVRNLLTSAVRG